MKSDRRTPVAIIGGGFSGTILAAHLARSAVHCVLIDGGGRMGRGVAYSTTEDTHLLNVCGDGMSAWAHDPDHFSRRVAAEGGDPRGYAQRRLFGRYLGEILDQAVASGFVEMVRAGATEASRDGEGWRVQLDNGETVAAEALVLAVGNQEPDRLGAFNGIGGRFIGNPWGAEARAAVQDLASSDGSALLVGTSLTMVDLVLSLEAAGHRGRVVALSRRGLVPRNHAEFEPACVELHALPLGSLRGLWRWLRKRSAQVGWRAAVDSLRPHSHPLWQSLDLQQQRRFLRHGRPWWDVHRHRIAPEVAATVERAIADKRLEVIAGRIISSKEVDGGLEIVIRRRGADETETLRFDYAFNCTGPLHSIERTKVPLLRSLMDGGHVRGDDLGIGLTVDELSRAGKRLWALGPLTKGRYWEIVAVPDIREQAAIVVEDLKRELKA